jgi:polyisoprenoid-binding protein YceI
MKKFGFIILVMLTVTCSTFSSELKWKFDKAHSKVQFNVKHMIINDVSGNFKDFSGEVITKDNNLNEGKIEFTIDVNSINTDNEKRDSHLKSDDFFNAEKFPKIIFVSKSIKKVSENKYKIVGDLTMRDVTKEVILDAQFNGSIKDGQGNERIGYKVSGTLNRFDYNLKWNALLEAGGAVVGKDVNIICDVELIKE